MKVQIVGKTTGVGKYSDLNSEEIVSAIARHGIIKEDQGKLIKYLMESAHWSPLDMINFVFEVETSRAIGRQMLRHSSIKPQEHSQRYSNKVKFESIELRKEHPTNRQSSTEIFDPIIEDSDFTHVNFWLNDGDIEDIKASELIDNYISLGDFIYSRLLSKGVAKECARMILPECTQTTLTFNGTLRSWLSFLNVRMDEHAQKEIQIIANEIGSILELELPNVFSKIDWKKGMFM